MRLVAFAILVVIISTPRCHGKPTREEIVSFHKKCRDDRIDIDLIGKFGADYRGLDLHGIDLRGEGWNGQWIKTIWRGADLSGANLERAVLSGVILDGANLKGVRAQGGFLGQAQLTNANLDDADLREARLDFIHLIGGSAKRADLTGAEISAADFSDTDLSGAVLHRVRCQCYSPRFQGANLTDMDFTGADLLPGAEFGGALLLRTNLRGTQLSRADFRGANLEKAIFADADVQYAQFGGVQGVTAAELADLEARSGRWRYELKVIWDHAIHDSYLLAYFLSPVLAIATGFRTYRRAGVSPQKRMGIIAIGLNVLALLALLTLLVFLIFSSPVAQFNAHDSGQMDAWSLWLSLWPILMLTLALGFCAAAVLTLISLAAMFLNARRWWPSVACGGLTLLHVGLQFQFMSTFFPTA